MRIFIPPAEIMQKSSVRLSEQKAHHLTTVLRAKKGDRVTVFDGSGRVYDALIAEISRKQVLVDILEEIPSESELRTSFILCAAVLKGEKMDFVVQKGTELGVMEIQPLITERTIVKESRRVARWRAIAEESCEQCGRAIIPAIHEPKAFDAYIRARAGLNGFIFWEEGGLPLAEAYQAVVDRRIGHCLSGPVYVMIGPEGGLTWDEIRCASSRGLIVSSLGRRILRAETAAIVALGLVIDRFEF
ncbi:MAG TPA: 16S rRNA (uracil(1498)-N(3))-methyltransferase [Dissulfurispiraceae bacterium]|nr:16S rRNA (uracil(1498)-N(3))-methyltransferase [Dissulfurispiraceae bacterium]